MTPAEAQARLDAARLTPAGMRMALAFLCGWSPDGVAAAVAHAAREPGETPPNQDKQDLLYIT